MIDVVAFDLDDTLWLESDAQARAMAELHRAWAVGAPFEAFVETWRDLSVRLFDAYTAGRLSHAEQRRGRMAGLLEAFGQPSDEASVRVWSERYVELYQSGWRPLPDADACLARLRAMGLGLAVVTNGDGAMQRAKLERMGLQGRFDWVLISGEIGAAKPDPAIFERLLADSGTPAERILFVGDRPDKDVEPARRMGMAALQIDHAGRAVGPGVVHGLGDVLTLVERERSAAPGGRDVGPTAAGAH